MKQTAVEWLVEQLKTMDTKSFNRLIQIEMSRENFEECFDQAKEMEKEQMCDFSNKLDINKALPLIDKFVSDFKINFRLFEDFKLENVISAFAKTVSNLLLYSPEKIGVELTKSRTLYIFSVVSNFKIHFEIFFSHNIEDEPYECVVNIFENRTLVLNKNGSFSEVIKEMEELIPTNSKKEIYYNETFKSE